MTINEGNTFHFDIFSTSLSILVVYLLLLLAVQGMFSNEEFIKFTIEFAGAFTATFIGVFVSFHLSEMLDEAKEIKNDERILDSNLKLIWSELDINKLVVKAIIDGIESLPQNITEYYECYKMLIKHSNSIKTGMFYGSVASGAMDEIAKKDDIFNALQQAYYNLNIGISGLIVSQEMFKDYRKKDLQTIHPTDLIILKELVVKESNKMKGVIEFITTAQNNIEKYLNAKGVTFKTDTND